MDNTLLILMMLVAALMAEDKKSFMLNLLYAVIGAGLYDILT